MTETAQHTDALAALRAELKQAMDAELVDYIIDRTVETVRTTRSALAIVTLGGSPRLAAVWGTAALFYVGASKFAGESSAQAAYQLAVLAAREARAFFAHMDRACERNGRGPYALTAPQLEQHVKQAKQAMGWLKQRKEAENPAA